jgi:hypothetical protein
MINLGRMRSKTLYYLILSAIIEYSGMSNNNEKHCQEGYASKNDIQEARKKME